MMQDLDEVVSELDLHFDTKKAKCRDIYQALSQGYYVINPHVIALKWMQECLKD